jgi:hypothetical protein
MRAPFRPAFCNGRRRSPTLAPASYCGDVPLPLGGGVLGGGFPAGGFGEVGFVEPGLLEPGLEPGFDVPGLDPGFEVPGLVEPGCEGAPGVLGFELGLVLGLSGFAFGLFGSVVEGCVPGALGLVGFDPGAVEGAVEPLGGWVVLPVGGCPVFPVGG